MDKAYMAVVHPIAQDEPCGEALDYDLDFLDLEILVRGRPERQSGDATSVAQPPDWKAVTTMAQNMAGRSHDIRLELCLARAAVNRGAGLSDLGQRLLRLTALVETFWLHLHPCPEEGDEEMTVRINALADWADPEGLLADLRRLPIAVSGRAGSYCLRDWLAARQEEGGEERTQKIMTALAEMDKREIERHLAGLRECLGGLAQLEIAIRGHVAAHEAPRLVPLANVLTQMQEMLSPYLSAQELAAVTNADDVAGTPDAALASRPASLSRSPQSRDDIIILLERICAWYRMNEPASPVPALLERARQLVAKDFLTLLEELAPEGAHQFRQLAGLKTQQPDN